MHQLVKEAGERANLVAELEDIQDLSVFYTDFTQIRYQHGLALAWLMPIGGPCEQAGGGACPRGAG